MTDPYMNDYFFNTKQNSNLKHAKSYSNLKNRNRHSSLNLSGSEIVYNNINNNKNSITSYLKQDNLLAHKQLDEINNEYNNMKDFLNNKVSKLEQQQQMQFETLKNYLEEKNLRDDLRSREKRRNNMMNEIKEQIDYEINQKRNLEKIRELDLKEKIERNIAKEKQEREQLFRELQYVEKIKRLDQMEKILLHKNLMNKKIQEMYNSVYYPNPYSFPGYLNSPFMSPLLLNMLDAYNNNNRQNEIMKLYLLKTLMEDDKPKKESPFIMKPPKYLIQKYYPPAPNTNYIPVPQPILFKSPDMPNPSIIPEQKEKPTIKVTLPKDETIRTKTTYESIPTKQKRKHKHKHKKKHKHRYETPLEDNGDEPEENEDDEEKDEKPSKEEDDEPQNEDDEDDKESEKKDKEEDDSSEPDVRLKLYDPDNPDDNRIVYPSRNPK